MHMSSDSVHNKEVYVLCKQFSFEWMADCREIMLIAVRCCGYFKVRLQFQRWV